MGDMSLSEAFVSGLIIGGGCVAVIAGAMFGVIHRLQRPDEHVLRVWNDGERTLALMEIDETP